MNGMEYGVLVAVQIALPALFLPYAMFTATLYFWRQSQAASALHERAIPYSGIFAGAVTLVGLLLFFGGILSGYDGAAGGAFNPGPNNWGMNYGILATLGGILVLWPITLVAMGIKAGVNFVRQRREA
ncbi:MAG: hypothetical protein KBE09_04085 [Candidatus Pacebacteria bacterium]|nr:hypothetical protein [Candidatus Paceibacterota bacterium]